MAAKHKAENRARPGAGSIPWPEPRPLPWPGSGQGTHGSHWWRAQFGSPARIREWAAQELTNGRLLPWFAVAYGAGVILYFTAEREPALWAAVVPAAACALGDAIAPNVYDALFVSGIGHVLSISGYHMALVAGVSLFHRPRLLRLDPAASRPRADQEMGRARRASCHRLLSHSLRQSGGDATFVHHDRRRAPQRAVRSPGADHAHADHRGFGGARSRRNRSCIRVSRCRLPQRSP